MVLVVADDLIWLSRLTAAAERSGAPVARATTERQLRDALAGAAAGVPTAAVVDLNGRAYDGVEAVRISASAGLPTIAVGQHEDLELRRRALDAGAQRVYSYNKVFRDGAQLIGRLIEAAPGSPR
jgi:DNA-binding response OmpR family regulator